MVEIFLLNALGDALIGLGVLYAAYAVRKHRSLAKYFVLIALVFFITAAVFARGLAGAEFFLFAMFSWILFSVAFVEATTHMIEGFSAIKYTYVLYLFLFMFAFLPNVDAVVVYTASIFISHLIIVSSLISLIVMKRGKARLFSVIGFLGIVIPVFIGLFDLGLAAAPWNYNLLPEKILIAVFFAGFAFSTQKEPYCFCDHKLLRKKGAKK